MYMKKYEELRSDIRNGDIICFRGTSFTSKLIHYFDKAYYSHIGLVFVSNNRLFMIDSNSHGVNPKFLSEVMHASSDFCIIRPQAWSDNQISTSVGIVFDRAERRIKYDFNLMPQIVLFRVFGIVKDFEKSARDICSEFVRRFTRRLSPKSICFEQPNIPTNFITPWDFILYADEKYSILYDESPKEKYRAK